MVLNGINLPSSLRCLLEGNGLLLIHSRDDCDQKILPIIETFLDARSEFTLRDFNIVFRCPVCRQEVEKTVINVHLRKAIRSWQTNSQ